MKYRILALLSCVVMIAGLLTGPAVGSNATASASNSQPSLAAPTAVNAPSVISIPAISTQPAPNPNGECAQGEYAGGISLPFTDGPAGGSGTIQMIHDSKNLYVCMTGALIGSYSARFGSLYLDPQGNGISYTYAQQDDFSLKVDIADSKRTSLRGTGVGQNPVSYLADSSLDSFWAGAASSINVDQVEYSVSLKDFKLDTCNIFGMAVYHHWLSGSGDDYGWPGSQWFDQPRTWQLATLGGTTCGNATGNIAYVFRGNTLDATSFYNFLSAAGYTVTLVPLGDVLTTNFLKYDLTIIADDTGQLNTWGTTSPVSLTLAQVAQITATSIVKPAGTPILGLGEGGYAFFGRLSLYIGWPRGWHGPQVNVRKAPGAPAAFYTSVVTPDPNPIPLYTTPFNSVGIYLKPLPIPGDVQPVGLEDPLDDHASLITQNCRMLWGNSANPLTMTGDGKTIFLNSVNIAKNFQQCTPPPTIAAQCQDLIKTANPVAPGPVLPGSTIQYTLTRTIPVDATCPAGKLVDTIPFGTTYVPLSATHGTVPDAAGTMTWVLDTAAGVQVESFKVLVSDIVCTANRLVANYSELRLSGSPPISSNTVTHNVTCPPVGFPNTQPLFAETELKITPYPLTAGVLTQASVRVTNLSVPATPQTVTVQFKTAAPAQLGIGLNYTIVLGSTSGIVPVSGSAVFSIPFVPAASGNACIQAVVTAAGASPISTESCLDVTESLSPGRTDTLTFPVRNNTASSATVLLVVDNTCPGWSAVITDPASYTFTGMAAGATLSATLSVTPPSSGSLGTLCHIDVQAWIGTTMIGGIRKIDVAPVHLPLDVQPPWEEQEITFVPNPPRTGVPGLICIQLVNPLGVNQIVSVDFSVADFGAGISFTPAASLINVNLAPNSVTTHCASWTPLSSGTLHRCVLATLKQIGYHDQTSQRNVDIVRPSLGSPGSLVIPFIAGNPDLVGHLLDFNFHLVGIDPAWTVQFEMAGGGALTLPVLLGPGDHKALQLHLVPAVALHPSTVTAPPPLIDFRYGSQHSVEVTMTLDGQPAGGFSAILVPNTIFMPTIRR